MQEPQDSYELIDAQTPEPTEEELLLAKQKQLQEEASELEKLYAIRAAECIESFYQFFIEFWDIVNQNAELVPNWHIKYLCDQFQEIVEQAIRLEPKDGDTVVNIPPGMTKSTILSQMLGAWAWIHAPHFVIITSTNSDALSVDHSLKSKDIVKSERWNKYFQPYIYKKFGKYLEFTKDNEKDWRNNFGGVRFFTSVGGAIIGKHAHLIIWDDLVDVEKADSEAIRKKANRHLTTVLPTRKKDKDITPTIGIMQRLHEDDPTGHILEKTPGMRHIKLPATAEGDVQPPELRERYVDGLLDPVRLGRGTLEEQKTLLGTYKFSGQFDQEPTPKGGGMIKEAWFNYLPEHELPKGLVWDLWIDGAYTKNKNNDPTGLMIAAYDRRRHRLYIKHAKSDHLEMPDLLHELPRYCDLHDLGRRSRVYIEPKASGLSLDQMLRDDTDLSPILIKSPLVTEGKEARANTASPRLEAGKVWLVEGAWTEAFVGQLCGFPVVKHDEYIDTLGYACEEYFGKPKAAGVKRMN